MPGESALLYSTLGAWIFFTKSCQTLVQVVFIDFPGSLLSERVMIPVTLERESLVKQGLQYPIVQDSHLYQLFRIFNYYPCSVSLYDVCNQVIRLFVHLETAVEIIHDLYVFSLSPERAATLVQTEVFKKICRHEFDGVLNRHIQLVDESIGGSLAVDLEHPFGDRIAVGAAFMSEHRMD